MKRIISITVSAAAGVLAAVSCSDILNQAPSDQYTDAQLWNDEYLVENHLAQLYAMCPVMINDALCVYSPDNSPLNINFSDYISMIGFSAQGEGPVHATTIADEAKYSGRGAQSNYVGMKLNGLQANSTTLRWWDNAYYLNRQLNHFIENISNSSLAEAEVRKAEARFLRAFNYFAMVKRYGGVPLILKETAINASEEELYPKRDSEKACYDFIIQECLDIAEILEDKPAAGRASKWAALALVSRAALYAGSIAEYGTMQLDNLLGINEDPKYYYDISVKASERIMNESTYDLYRGNSDKVQNLKDIFLVKDNCEAIMVKRHSGLGGEQSNSRWSWDICCCPKPNAWSVGQYSLPYYDFVENFDFKNGDSGKIPREELEGKAWSMEEFFGERDPRLSAWFWTNGTSWPGAVGAPVFADNTISMYRGIKEADGNIFFNATAPTYRENEGDEGILCYGDQMAEMLTASTTTGFGVMKYLDPNADNLIWFVQSTTDYQIFRYAEILLNHAEACFKLGRPGEALDDINNIRDRAGVAPLSNITFEAIQKERMTELCFENHRYWDLRRWRQAVDVLDNKPHQGIVYILDYESYKEGNPKFWIQVDDQIDDKTTNPKFPENNYYFPIGDGTTAANPNLLENPDYL